MDVSRSRTSLLEYNNKCGEVDPLPYCVLVKQDFLCGE